MANAQTTSWLGALITLVLTPTTTLKGITEGSPITHNKYPWAFVTVDVDSDVVRHIGAPGLQDCTEQLVIDIHGRTINEVRYAQQELILWLNKPINYSATLSAYGVIDILNTGRDFPKKFNPTDNSIFSGQCRFDVLVRYSS